jgi:hypothetical protein
VSSESFLLTRRKLRQLLPDSALTLSQLPWNLNLRQNKKVTTRSRRCGKSVATQTETLAGLSSARQFQAGTTLQCWHLQLAAQHRPPWLNLDFVNQVAPLDAKIRMPSQSHPQEQVAASPSTGSGFPLAR